MSDIGITTPSPILTPKSSSIYTLSEQINAATRPIHSELNRLIVARLPLALPPHVSNPHTYLTGLIHVASIYATFEQLWQNILDAPDLPSTPSKPPSFDACDPDLLDIDSSRHRRSKVCTRTHSVLQHLHLPGLLRNDRIRADIRTLSGLQGHDIDERLENVSQIGPLADFLAHIKRSVETNPHVLLAYAWVLYMALFSGGRFLRLSLYAAGPSFWGQCPVPTPFADRPNPFLSNKILPESQNSIDRGRRASIFNTPYTPNAPSYLRKSSLSESSTRAPASPSPGLQFFNFTGDEDGEDIKLEFKRRIVESEVLLTLSEKDDIIQEAQEIFKFMVALVHFLDGVCQYPSDESDASDESTGSVVKTKFPVSGEDSSTDSLGGLLDIKQIHSRNVAMPRSRDMPRDSVAINHDRLRKQHESDTQKDSIPSMTAPTRSTTIVFEGQDRESSLETVLEPVKKIVRWGTVETVYSKISTRVEGLGRDVRRMSTVTWREKEVIGSGITMPLVVVMLAVSALSLLWYFGFLEQVE